MRSELQDPLFLHPFHIVVVNYLLDEPKLTPLPPHSATLLYFVSTTIVVPTATVTWGYTAGSNDTWSSTIIDSSLNAAATAAVPPAQKKGAGGFGYVDKAEIVFGQDEYACEPLVTSALHMYASKLPVTRALF